MSVKRRKLPESVRRAAIMEAAYELFHEKGYERARMDEVAELAGLTKGGVYFHFKNKRALLEALLKRQHENFKEFVDEHRERDEPDPRRRIGGFLLGLVDKVYREHFPASRSSHLGILELFLESHRQEVLNLEVRDCYREIRAFLAEAVEQGRRAGLFGVDPFTAAVAGVALVEGMYLQYAMDYKAFDPQMLGRRMVDAYLAGLEVVSGGET